MEQPHKRILVVSQHYWPENFRITDICRGFAESGVEVDVLCGLPNYPKGEWFEGYRYAGRGASSMRVRSYSARARCHAAAIRPCAFF